MWMSTDIKEAVAASIVAQDERPISYERRGHHRATLTREKSQASLIYQMVSFDTATGYVGQVAYREQTYERMVEHWRGIGDYDYNGEAKYAFMHRHGGAGSWFFVP